MHYPFKIQNTIPYAFTLPSPEHYVIHTDLPPAGTTPENPYTTFALNTAHTPSDAVLRASDGAEIGSITMESGELADAVYTTANGLHINSSTRCVFPVQLGDQFTISLTVTDFATSVSSTTYGLFPLMVALPGGQFETVVHAHKPVSSTKYLWSYLNRVNSPTINTAPWVRSIEYATDAHWIYNSAVTMDWLSEQKDLAIRYVADGETVSMYVNGLLTAWQPQSEFTNNLTELYVGSWGNSINLSCEYTIKEFRVLNYAELPTEFVNYRLRITGVKGSTSPYMQLSELMLFDDSQNQIAITDAIPFALYNGYADRVSYPAAGDNVHNLFDADNTNKMCVSYADGTPFDIIFALPRGTEKPQYCAYVTGNDYPERDPVTWEIARCTDGETWETVGAVTGAEITDERNVQTDMFALS